MTSFQPPKWVPRVEPGTRILVAGASGGLGRALVDMLLKGSDCVIGAHGATKMHPAAAEAGVIPIVRPFEGDADCVAAVAEFCDKAGGIDALVMLAGGLTNVSHWDELTGEEWENDIDINLNVPFFLARAAMRRMKAQGTGGRIILNGTESALHGGSPQSFPYAIAKRGTECMVQGLAREGASHSILVNGVRFGFIESGFHQRWLNKTGKDLEKRAELVPLKRGGHPDEAAALIIYLMSGWGQFITGQMIPLTGGDWL